jgi:hypothetical protein
MQTTAPKKIVIGFVAGHLLLVACGAAGFAPWKHGGFAGHCVSLYGHLTGSSNSYGFFAPNVANQLITTVTAEDVRGDRRVMQFGGGGTETDRRVSTMMMVFANAKCPQMHGLSLAAYTLGKNPAARTVIVGICQRRLPTMAEYRQGERPDLEEIYRGAYGRRLPAHFHPEPK